MTQEILDLSTQEIPQIPFVTSDIVRSELEMDDLFPWAKESVLDRISGTIAETVDDNCRILNVPLPGLRVIPLSGIEGNFVDLSTGWINERGEYAADIYAHSYLSTYKTTGFREELLRLIAQFDDSVVIGNIRRFRRDQQSLNNYMQGTEKDLIAEVGKAEFGFSARMDAIRQNGVYRFTLNYEYGYLREVVDDVNSKNNIKSVIELRRKTAHEIYHEREAMLFPTRFFSTAH